MVGTLDKDGLEEGVMEADGVVAFRLVGPGDAVEATGDADEEELLGTLVSIFVDGNAVGTLVSIFVDGTSVMMPVVGD